MMSDDPLPRPVEMRRGPGNFDPTSDTIKVRVKKVSKDLKFQVLALPGVGYTLVPGDVNEVARVFYVSTTRDTQGLVMGASGDGLYGVLLQ